MHRHRSSACSAMRYLSHLDAFEALLDIHLVCILAWGLKVIVEPCTSPLHSI